MCIKGHNGKCLCRASITTRLHLKGSTSLIWLETGPLIRPSVTVTCHINILLTCFKKLMPKSSTKSQAPAPPPPQTPKSEEPTSLSVEIEVNKKLLLLWCTPRARVFDIVPKRADKFSVWIIEKPGKPGPGQITAPREGLLQVQIFVNGAKKPAQDTVLSQPFTATNIFYCAAEEPDYQQLRFGKRQNGVIKRLDMVRQPPESLKAGFTVQAPTVSGVKVDMGDISISDTIPAEENLVYACHHVPFSNADRKPYGEFIFKCRSAQYLKSFRRSREDDDDLSHQSPSTGRAVRNKKPLLPNLPPPVGVRRSRRGKKGITEEVDELLSDSAMTN